MTDRYDENVTKRNLVTASCLSLKRINNVLIDILCYLKNLEKCDSRFFYCHFFIKKKGKNHITCWAIFIILSETHSLRLGTPHLDVLSPKTSKHCLLAIPGNWDMEYEI